MREVNNNNPEFGKIPQRPEIKLAKIEEAINAAEQVADEKIVSSFDNPKAAFLGRSQVNNIDALQQDIAFGMKNPDVIEKADKFFDIAYKQFQAKNEPDAYAKASELTSVYVSELGK